MKRILCMLLLVIACAEALAAGVRVRGKVEDVKGEPVPGAVIRLDENYLWAVTDAKGVFVLESVEPGSYQLETECLGYAADLRRLRVTGAIDNLIIVLQEQTLALNEVVVTAEQSKENLNTTRKIERTALEHLQVSGLSNIAALMPGGKTANPDLTAASELTVRGGGSTTGNAAFGTAVEVNGVRMGDNAAFGGLAGVDTRSLQVENIESVEVISGVPSAEYGDLGSGMVRVTTRKGRTPVQATFAVNPRTYDVSVSKGIVVGEGVLNVSGQWTRATQKLTSPYTSYTRRGFTAEYSRTFGKKLRLEAGITGNIGGMDSKDDPDAFSNEFTKARDNLLTPHLKLTWLLNKSWITNLSLEGSVYYHDNRTHEHLYNSYGTSQPAVHAEEEGYFLATALPTTFYADRITDSQELDYAASLKYDWLHHFGDVKSVLKAGVQWKADGNVGAGEYYENPALAANGYRPRPYTDYPYMHNLAVYVEEKITWKGLEVSAGLRGERTFIEGSQYQNLQTLSPRLNARYHVTSNLSFRGGWGITRKLPGFYILFPRQEYRDIQTFGFSHGNEATYLYYTIPYTMTYNPDLRWQSNRNAEIGVDYERWGWSISLAAFRNVTKDPYELANLYTPISYTALQLPAGFQMPADPQMVVDQQTGAVYLRGEADEYWTPMDVRVNDRTFAGSRMQRNGADVVRSGLELTADFPEIPYIRTRLRLDAAYTHTKTLDENRYAYYQSGWSHTELSGRSYQYAGIYAGGATLSNGRRTDYLDANLTAITHIPEVRLIITCRVEAALLRSAQNLSTHAFTVSKDSLEPTGEDLYAGNSYTAVYPVAYIDLDGQEHAWTAASASDPALQRLILRSGNMYTFARDGYDPYLSANLSLTKEIGDHVSLSFFANNFTNARPYRKSYATGVSAIFTPAFYYGLTCRIKL
jgi:outer membrane receptor protein involved in Fe transport